MIIKVLFTTSKRIHPRIEKLQIGKYSIEPFPGSFTLIQDVPTTDRYLLQFEDTVDEERGAHPFEEARLFLSYWALIFGTKLYIVSEMINSLQSPVSARHEYYPEFYGIIDDLPNIVVLLGKLKSLDIDLARQYLRACEVYQTAVKLIEENATFSFFLLTVSIECLSNKVITGNVRREVCAEVKEMPKGTCDKFVEFILTYLPSTEDFSTKEEWEGFLKEIYYNHRSGFTHGGKNIPYAAILADRLNRKYITNTIDGKEIKTPGLRWFETVVRRCLISFLDNGQVKEESQQSNHFKELSYEFGKVELTTNRSLQRGPVVISDENFDLD